MAYNSRWYRLADINRTHARYKQWGIQHKTILFFVCNCVQHNNCVVRVELDESQCKCVESVHSNGKCLCAS